ncbi:hypothetical protein KKC1_33190, partial [Calderihabitans maritimus]
GVQFKSDLVSSLIRNYCPVCSGICIKTTFGIGAGVFLTPFFL